MKIKETKILKTKNGDDYEGHILENDKRLSIFKFDPRYGQFTVGDDIPAELLVYNQQYDNYNLKPIEKPAGNGGSRTGMMKQMAEEKDRRIRENMDTKQENIEWNGASRDATLMLTTLIQAFPEEWRTVPTNELKSAWLSWRDFYLHSRDMDMAEPFEPDPRKS